MEKFQVKFVEKPMIRLEKNANLPQISFFFTKNITIPSSKNLTQNFDFNVLFIFLQNSKIFIIIKFQPVIPNKKIILILPQILVTKNKKWIFHVYGLTSIAHRISHN